MLQTELAEEAFPVGFAGSRDELLTRDSRKQMLLFESRVKAKRMIEPADRGRLRSRVLRSHRREKPAEQVVQPAMIEGQQLGERRRERLGRHGRDAGERTSSSRPSTEDRTSASRAPASKP